MKRGASIVPNTGNTKVPEMRIATKTSTVTIARSWNTPSKPDRRPRYRKNIKDADDAPITATTQKCMIRRRSKYPMLNARVKAIANNAAHIAAEIFLCREDIIKSAEIS